MLKTVGGKEAQMRFYAEIESLRTTIEKSASGTRFAEQFLFIRKNKFVCQKKNMKKKRDVVGVVFQQLVNLSKHVKQGRSSLKVSYRHL